jgi:hypothetical protein
MQVTNIAQPSQASIFFYFFVVYFLSQSKPSKAKQSQAKPSKAKQSKAKQGIASI